MASVSSGQDMIADTLSLQIPDSSSEQVLNDWEFKHWGLRKPKHISYREASSDSPGAPESEPAEEWEVEPDNPIYQTFVEANGKRKDSRGAKDGKKKAMTIKKRKEVKKSKEVKKRREQKIEKGNIQEVLDLKPVDHPHYWNWQVRWTTGDTEWITSRSLTEEEKAKLVEFWRKHPETNGPKHIKVNGVKLSRASTISDDHHDQNACKTSTKPGEPIEPPTCELVRNTPEILPEPIDSAIAMPGNHLLQDELVPIRARSQGQLQKQPPVDGDDDSQRPNAIFPANLGSFAFDNGYISSDSTVKHIREPLSVGQMQQGYQSQCDDSSAHSRPAKRRRLNESYNSDHGPSRGMLSSQDAMPIVEATQQSLDKDETVVAAMALQGFAIKPNEFPVRPNIEADSTPDLTPATSNTSPSSSPGPNTPSDHVPLQPLLFPSLQPQGKQPPHFYNQINHEQQSLFKDPRVIAQLKWFKRAQVAQPAMHYSGLAPIGIHILESGSPAQTHTNIANTDYLNLDSKQLDDWLVNGTGDKLIVLRDNDWFNTRPVTSGTTVLEELRIVSGEDLQIEVQKLEKTSANQPSVESMPIAEIMTRFADKSQTGAPINLLSLMCKDDGTVPWPLGKHCNLLNQAAAFSASTAATGYRASAGKHSIETMSRYIDLQSCIHFQIFGQAGAISSWHIDSIGPYTYVTLEPNIVGQPASDVLKLWAFVRTDNLSLKEQAQIKKGFKDNGGAYMPNPKHIRVISLVAGDTLIMPPGVIHAPITITDCLFRGGMVMQKKQMRRSIQEWRFCSDNGQCTNENQPKQARSVLDYFRRLVSADPESCGYTSNTVAEFEDSWRAISGRCMICRCEGDCKKSKCGCIKNSQRCGSQCHKGKAECSNPHGCDADFSPLLDEPKIIATIEPVPAEEPTTKFSTVEPPVSRTAAIESVESESSVAQIPLSEVSMSESILTKTIEGETHTLTEPSTSDTMIVEGTEIKHPTVKSMMLESIQVDSPKINSIEVEVPKVVTPREVCWKIRGPSPSVQSSRGSATTANSIEVNVPKVAGPRAVLPNISVVAPFEVPKTELPKTESTEIEVLPLRVPAFAD